MANVATGLHAICGGRFGREPAICGGFDRFATAKDENDTARRATIHFHRHRAGPCRYRYCCADRVLRAAMNYRPTREESENIIKLLIEHYPKCFFDNPKQRRPLKKNIEIDIKNDPDFNVGPDVIDAAVEWYKTHIGYDYALAAGAKRVDLNGREVGTITQAEAQAAQQRINEIHKAKNPVEVLQNMHATRRISDDGVKKLDAPVISRSKIVHPPEFDVIYEKLAAASAAVISINDPAMRAAVVKATLDEVLKTIEQVKEGLP